MDTTSASLLIRLQSVDLDTVAWNRFVELYTPLIYYWARKMGLQSNDASDLVQDVLTTLIRKLPEFRHDPEKSFRGWLRTVTRNKLREQKRRKSIKVVEASTSEFVNIADPIPDYWDTIYPGQLLDRAMELAKPMFENTTWLALSEYLKDERTATESAHRHGVSVWTVYSAKSRLLAHLREQLEGLMD